MQQGKILLAAEVDDRADVPTIPDACRANPKIHNAAISVHLGKSIKIVDCHFYAA